MVKLKREGGVGLARRAAPTRLVTTPVAPIALPLSTIGVDKDAQIHENR
jgi:hypothetical protein